MNSDFVNIHKQNGCLKYFKDINGQEEEFSYKRPYLLELEISRKCNLNCIHCYAEANDNIISKELSLSEIEIILKEAKELGIIELSLTGGEVLLNPNFLNILDIAINLGFQFRFATNGWLLDDIMIENLKERGIKMITISLDGMSAEIHDKIRGVSGSFDKVIEALKRSKKAGIYTSILTAFSKININDFDAIFDFCVKNEIHWQIQMVAAKGRCPMEITLSPEEYYELGKKTAKIFEKELPIAIIPMDDLATYSLLNPLNKLFDTWQFKCSGGILNIFIRANGDVTPCSALSFDECIIGNIRKDSLIKICEEERCKKYFEWLSVDNLKGTCSTCPVKKVCLGGCPEILLKMCSNRRENEYCYYRIERKQILSTFS